MNNKEISHQSNLRKVVYLSLSLMVLFTAYSACQGRMAVLYTQLGYGHLGKLCLFCLWSTMGVTSMVSAHYNKKISVKTGLVFGAIAHGVVIGAGLLTSYCNKNDLHNNVCRPFVIFTINIFCAFCAGLGAAFLWLGQATYVNNCATEKTKGLFNGTFWSIFQTCQIFGSALSTYLLGNFDQFTFYSILMLFTVISVGMLCFVQSPSTTSSELEVNVNSEEKLSQVLRNFQRVLEEKKYHFMFMAFLFHGTMTGCFVTFLGKIVTMTVTSKSQNVINQSIGYVLMILAIGQILAGMSIGRLADRYNKIKLLTITIIIGECAMVAAFLACIYRAYELALLCGLLWGFSETALQTMFNTVIGTMFNGRAEIFSAYRFFQCLGMMFAAALGIILPQEMPLLYLSIITGVMIILHLFYRIWSAKSENSSKTQRLLQEEEMRTFV